MKLSFDNEQLLSFTKWKAGYIYKKGKSEIINKLNSIGMMNVTVSGKGSNKVYTFDIPESFWLTLPILHMKHSELLTDIMKILVDGNVVNGLVMFHSEYYEKLASKHNTTTKAVENKFNSVKSYLNEMDMLEKNNYRKSHRIIPDGYQTWLTGGTALAIDTRIRELWIAFHERYQRADKELLQKFQKDFYFKEIPRVVGASYYRTVKMSQLSPQYTEDVLIAKQLFLETFDLELVRKELHKKHETYRELSKQRKREVDALKQARLEAMFQ